MSKFKPVSTELEAPRALPLRPRTNRTAYANGFTPQANSLSAPDQQSPVTEPTNPVVPDEPAVTSIGRAVTLITLCFLFFRLSFTHDVITTKAGFDTHLILILGGAAIITGFISGRLALGFAHKIFYSWLAFAALMTMASITSVWPGGSFTILWPYYRTTLLLVVLIPAAAYSLKTLKMVLLTAGVAGIAFVILGLTMNDLRSGRLELVGAGTAISNANDYAAFLMFLIPAIFYFTLRQGTSFVMKIIGLGALGASGFLVLSTGSRGALISLLASGLYILKVGSTKIRLAMLLGIPLAAVITWPLVPPEATARLGTLFEGTQHVDSEAAASQNERTELLMQSLKFTMQHPILGVGPGSFQIYQAQEAAAAGTYAIWHETHNSYTQVASECGIPALVLFLAAIVMTFRIFRRGMKSDDPDIRAMSTTFSLMLVSFGICMFFLSQAYGFGFPVMGGVAISLDRILKRRASVVPPPPMPVG